MVDEPNSPAPHCTRCGRLYTEGRAGVCSACRQAARRSTRRKPYQSHRKPSLVCQCGQPAVTVILVSVGRPSDGLYTVRMPLCHTCLQLEQAMWEESNKSDKLR
jgi:hypothetical protein